MKVEGLIGFNGNGDEFQIMDKNYSVYVLKGKRNKG